MFTDFGRIGSVNMRKEYVAKESAIRKIKKDLDVWNEWTMNNWQTVHVNKKWLIIGYVE